MKGLSILKKKLSKQTLFIVLGCLGICILASVIGIAALLLDKDPYDHRIADGVSVGSVSLGGLSRSEAKKALKEVYGNDYSRNAMEVVLPDTVLSLTPKQTKAKLNRKKAVDAAYSVGRNGEDSGRQFPVTDFLGLDQDTIRGVLEDYQSGFTGSYIPSSCQVEGKELVITMGQSGFCVDLETLYHGILDAYNDHVFTVKAPETAPTAEPSPMNYERVVAEIYVPAKEPSVDLHTLKPVPGETGRDFDRDQVQKLLKTAGQGDVLRVPLMELMPEHGDEDACFMDVLGYCETPHGNNENRNHNLRLACAAINGLVLQPGEEFSYNETLGERTTANGYKPAPAYSGTNLVDSPGGGICQVSSTLYLASVYAEMTIVERVNHGYPVSYIPLGMDATVNWGFTDLKMRNDSDLPIKILAEESDSKVKVTVLGTELRDYTVEMSYTVGGRHVRTYKSIVDRKTGEVRSKEPFALSSYLEDVHG